MFAWKRIWRNVKDGIGTTYRCWSCLLIWGDRSPSTPAPAPRRRLRLVDDKADATETKGTKRPVESAAVDLPPKRSARFLEKPLGLPQPKPFNVDLAAKSLAFKRRRSRSGGTEPCEESPNNEMPKSAVEMSEDSGKGANMESVAASEVAKEQQDQKQEKLNPLWVQVVLRGYFSINRFCPSCCCCCCCCCCSIVVTEYVLYHMYTLQITKWNKYISKYMNIQYTVCTQV